MEYPFIVHVEDSECNLCGPIEYLLFLEFFARSVLLLVKDELIDIAT
jgi:hypothetical protein